MSAIRTRSVAVHAAGQLVSQAAGILSFLLLANTIGVEKVGRLAALLAAPQFFCTMATASLAIAVTVEVSRLSSAGYRMAGDLRQLLKIATRRTTIGMGMALPFTTWEALRCEEGVHVAVGVVVLCILQTYLQSLNAIQIAIVRGLGAFDTNARISFVTGALRFVILVPLAWGADSLVDFIAASLVSQLLINRYCEAAIRVLTKADASGRNHLGGAEAEAKVRKFIRQNQRSNLITAGANWLTTASLSAFSTELELGKWALLSRLINILIFVPQRFSDVNLTEISKQNSKNSRRLAWLQGLAAFSMVAVAGVSVYAFCFTYTGLEPLSVYGDARLTLVTTATAGFMCLMRMRSQLEFAKLASTFENNSSYIRFLVTAAGMTLLTLTATLNAETASTVRLLSYMAALAAMIFVDYNNGQKHHMGDKRSA